MHMHTAHGTLSGHWMSGKPNKWVFDKHLKNWWMGLAMLDAHGERIHQRCCNGWKALSVFNIKHHAFINKIFLWNTFSIFCDVNKMQLHQSTYIASTMHCSCFFLCIQQHVENFIRTAGCYLNFHLDVRSGRTCSFCSVANQNGCKFNSDATVLWFWKRCWSRFSHL